MSVNLEQVKLSTNWGDVQLVLNNNFSKLDKGKYDSTEAAELTKKVNDNTQEIDDLKSGISQSDLMQLDEENSNFVKGKNEYASIILDEAKRNLACVVLDHIPTSSELTYTVIVNGKPITYNYLIGQLVRGYDTTNLENPLPFLRVQSITGFGDNKTITWVNATGGGSGGGPIINTGENFKWFELMKPSDIVDLIGISFIQPNLEIIIDEGIITSGTNDILSLVVYNPINATDKQLIFSSNNQDVILDNGVITSLPNVDSEFTVAVVSIDGNHHISLPVKLVYIIPVTSVVITNKVNTLWILDTWDATVVVAPINTSYPEYSVTLSDPTVISYQKVGSVDKFTAIKNGTCDITIFSTHYPNSRDTNRIAVNTDVTAINLLNPIFEITIGETYQLNVEITPSTANINNKLTWASSNPEIMGVSQGGLVTALSVGNAVITVTNGKLADVAAGTITETNI